MVTIWEVLAGVEDGPACLDRDFDLKLFSTKVTELVRDREIKCDPECVIPSDNSLADDVFEAGLDLAIDVGLWCRETGRRITFQQAEVDDELKHLPSEIVIGIGKDSRVMRHRFIEDHRPPLIQMGPLGQSTSEDMFTIENYVFAREPLMDYFNGGSLRNLYGREIRAGSPSEVEAGKYEISMIRDALRRAGRPGTHILGVESSIGDLGQIAAASTEGGLRKSDGHMVAMAAELKTDYPALSKVVHILGYGAFICGLYTVFLGGLAGGAEGSAITRVAGSILTNAAYKASYSITNIRDLSFYQRQMRIPRLKNLLWSGSVSQQAMSRNSKMLIGDSAHGIGGPGTEMFFYECAVATIAHVVSGASFVETSFAAENRFPDRPGVLEARFTAELAHAIAAASIRREDANELIRNIISHKLKGFEGKDAPMGGVFKELYDIDKLTPRSEYVNLYRKVKAETQDLFGIQFDRNNVEEQRER